MKNIIVRLRDIEKNYGGKSVIDHLNLDVAQGEFLTLLGPSGCGKTTTLRMIGGFEDTDGGQIFLEDKDVAGKAPNHRDVNTVFQSYALFPHMNVFDNVAFGLVEKKVPKAEIKKRVDEMIELVQLQGMEKRMPSQMSGGQKQRVAIARALVNRPKVLLLDEPLGALDLKLRKQMQFELKELQKKLKITFIYVTHDQEAALTMSDRIAVMNEGRIEQLGTPVEIYNHPKTKFVADFIGESNIFEAYIEEKKGNRISLVMESGKVELDAPDFEYDEMVYGTQGWIYPERDCDGTYFCWFHYKDHHRTSQQSAGQDDKSSGRRSNPGGYQRISLLASQKRCGYAYTGRPGL